MAQDLIRYWTVKPLPRPNRALCFSMLLLEKFGRKNTKGCNSLLEYLDLLSFSVIHIFSSVLYKANQKFFQSKQLEPRPITNEQKCSLPDRPFYVGRMQ